MKLPIFTLALALQLAGCASTNDRNEWTDNGMFQQALQQAGSFEQFTQKQSAIERAKQYIASARHGKVTIHALNVRAYWVDSLYEKSMSAVREQLTYACNIQGGKISYDDYWDNLVNGNIDLQDAGLSAKNLMEYKQHDDVMRRLLTNPPIHTLQERSFELLTPQEVQTDKGETKTVTHLKYWGKQSALCIKHQKVISAFTIGQLALYDTEDYGPSIVSFPAFNYLDAESLRKIEIISVKYWDSYMSDVIESSNRKKRIAEQKWATFEEQMTKHKNVWADRLEFTYTRGDKICTYSNRIGFIDDINGDNFRIIFAKEFSGQQGKFFGHWPFSAFEDDYTYTGRYKKLQETVWMQKSDFAHCTIDL